MDTSADDCGCSRGKDWLKGTATLEFTAFDASVVAGEYCRGGNCTPFSTGRGSPRDLLIGDRDSRTISPP